MRPKQKQNAKETLIRVKELCNELLRLCHKSPEASNFLDYFGSLKSVTSTIEGFQKNLSIVEAISKGDREIKLKSLEHKYKDYLECKISIQNSESAGFGLRAEEPIKKNTRLLHVPAEDMLYLKNLTTQLPKFLVKDPIFCGMNNVALSIATLHELSLGEKSKFKEYISSLPSTYSTVAYLSVDDFAVVDGFPAAELVLNTYRNICRQYAYFYLLFDRMKDEIVLPNYMKSFCFKDYQWAISTVMSRNNMIPGNEGEVLCLIPLWDMINHKQGQLTTDFDPASRSLVFYATESYEKGDEIFMDYGKRTSTEFLLYSGFVPEINRFHKVPIKLGLSKYDKLLTLRTRVLEKQKLSSEINVSVSSPDESPLPVDFFVFGRVFVMSESELQFALKADESTDNILSNVLSDNRIDNAARKFIEDRLTCLVRAYKSRLEKKLQSAQVKGPLHEHEDKAEMAAPSGLTQQPLYGGALEIQLPSPANDVSNFRQVPDNQEIFVNPANNQSIIVDILEALSEPDLVEAVKFHFQEIAECNSATETIVDSVEVQNIPGCPSAVLLRGKQKTAKFNREDSDTVAISIMLYRFTQFASDILVCFNDPIL
ncbi:unnamed protein product [Rodentolepis nana]|uniref:protein-histidine N-methyltransferase n=1 Tax=Rodentolepis nana TaxID=102285 RepID=A0A158QH58_RODNA|nr:unnamed protein product [Rodentolepis nana]